MKRLFVIGPQLKTEDLTFFSPDSVLDRFVFVDGGIDRYNELCETLPLDYFSVGDQDSSKFQMTIRLNPQKKDSDLAVAMTHLPLSEEDREVFMLGFLDGRKDHELFNLKVFSDFLQKKDGLILNLSPELIGFSGAKTWHLQHQGTFSLFSINDSQFSISGEVLYSLEKTLVTSLSSQLLSNVALGDFQVFSEHSFFFYKPALKFLSNET